MQAGLPRHPGATRRTRDRVITVRAAQLHRAVSASALHRSPVCNALKRAGFLPCLMRAGAVPCLPVPVRLPTVPGVLLRFLRLGSIWSDRPGWLICIKATRGFPV